MQRKKTTKGGTGNARFFIVVGIARGSRRGPPRATDAASSFSPFKLLYVIWCAVISVWSFFFFFFFLIVSFHFFDKVKAASKRARTYVIIRDTPCAHTRDRRFFLLKQSSRKKYNLTWYIVHARFWNDLSGEEGKKKCMIYYETMSNTHMHARDIGAWVEGQSDHGPRRYKLTTRCLYRFFFFLNCRRRPDGPTRGQSRMDAVWLTNETVL